MMKIRTMAGIFCLLAAVLGLSGCSFLPRGTEAQDEPEKTEAAETMRAQLEEYTLPQEVDRPWHYTGELEIEHKRPPRYIFTYQVDGRDLLFHGYAQGHYRYTDYEKTIKALYNPAMDEAALALCPASYQKETGDFVIHRRSELAAVARAICAMNEVLLPEAQYHEAGYRMTVEMNVWVYLAADEHEETKPLRLTKQLVLPGCYGERLDEAQVRQKLEADYDRAGEEQGQGPAAERVRAILHDADDRPGRP